MKPKDVLRRAIGGYLIGFNYASDTLANTAKKVIKVIHPLIGAGTARHRRRLYRRLVTHPASPQPNNALHRPLGRILRM